MVKKIQNNSSLFELNQQEVFRVRVWQYQQSASHNTWNVRLPHKCIMLLAFCCPATWTQDPRDAGSERGNNKVVFLKDRWTQAYEATLSYEEVSFAVLRIVLVEFWIGVAGFVTRR